MSIVLPDRPGARRPRSAAPAAKSERPIGRSLLAGLGVFVIALAGAKYMSAPSSKQPRATAMTLTPAAQTKKRLAEPRLPSRGEIAEAPARNAPDRQAARASEPAGETGGARERAVRRIALDGTATNSISSSRKPVIPGGGLMASREGAFGGFAPLERAEAYEGFRVTGGAGR